MFETSANMEKNLLVVTGLLFFLVAGILPLTAELDTSNQVPLSLFAIGLCVEFILLAGLLLLARRQRRRLGLKP